MARFSRRKVTVAAVGALAFALLGGGIATAAPNDQPPQPAGPGIAAPAPVEPDGDAAVQPPVSKAEKARAKAALVQSTSAGLALTTQTSFAVVGSNGTLVRGFEAVSATRLGTGYYQVVFNHDLTGSAFVASTGFTGSLYVPPPGIAVVVGRTGIPNGVFVATYNANGSRVDRAFHLAVHS